MNTDMDNVIHLKPRKSAKNTILIILCILLAACIILFILIYRFVNSEANIVANGTYITLGNETLSIGDLPYDKAADRLNSMTEKFMESTVTLKSSSKDVSSKVKDLGVSMDSNAAIQEIKNCVYGSNIYESISRHRHFSKTIQVMGDIKIDNKKLDKFVADNLNFIEKKPSDAVMSVDKSGNIQIKKEVQGSTLDKEKLLTDIYNAVKLQKAEVSLTEKILSPKVTENQLKELSPKKLVSTFTTYYGGSDANRKENVRLGASLINNTLLKPGEEFEYWKYVGESTPQRGFKVAGVYVNGQVSTDYGGGLCQVSTTLYNAALLADLKITARYPHGLPVHYVPLGLDATVSYGSVTLKFKNNTNSYILIKSSTNGKNITFKIYGKPVEGKTVKVYSNVVAHNTADAFRDVYINGKLTRHEYLGRSKYKDFQ